MNERHLFRHDPILSLGAFWGLLKAVLDKEWRFGASAQASSARQVRFLARNGMGSASVGIAALYDGIALERPAPVTDGNQAGMWWSTS